VSQGQKIPVAVVNGTGYGGVELLRLLARHPTFEVVEVTARAEAGKLVASIFPQLGDMRLAFTERVSEAKTVFVALPDHAAAEVIPGLLAEGRRVLDLSAAFRLRDAAEFAEWYGYPHPAPDLLRDATYGLVETARETLPQARLVACPGCYPTAALLAVLPALRADLIEPDVIVDAKSGVSGAGRTLRLTSHFSEANEDFTAYGVTGHRHWPEIMQCIRQETGGTPRLTFTPHLAPMTRGILATCYATLRPGVTAEQVAAAYHDAYANESFVRVVNQPPHTKWTLGSNMCMIMPTIEPHSQRLILISALDNLVKGAAGQAVQAANIMHGLPESLGLPREGVYP
jgi:N-acetyl-gamma-glutamyl-phosphate reductase